MRIFWNLAVVAWVGCAHQPVQQPLSKVTAQLDEIPTSWLGPVRGERVTYPNSAWDADIEGVVTLDLCLDRGKVIRTENVSGPPELTAAVLKVAAGWEFISVNVLRVTRVYRFKKYVSPADLQENEEGTFLVTRGFDPPSIPDSDVFQALENDPGVSRGRAGNREQLYPSFTTGLHWCADAGGKVESVKLVFTDNQAGAKRLLDRFYKVKIKPAKLRGEPIPSCGNWWGTFTRIRNP